MFSRTRSEVTSDVFLAAIDGAQAVPLVGEAARVSAEVATGVVSEVASGGAIDAVAAAGEGAAELTSGVLEVLGDILGAIDF